MTVIKIKQQTEFSTLSNSVLQNEKLSIESIGLWAHCMSRPADWTFYVKQLCSQFRIGKERMYKIINELIEEGYAFRGQKMETKESSLAGNRKVFSTIEYIFFPYQISQKEYLDLKKEYPGSEFKKSFSNGNLPLTESPLTENRPLQNKEELHIKDKERETPEAKAPAPPVSVDFISGNVKMAQQEYDKLVKRYGKTIVDEKIEALDDRSKIYPAEFKKYKCHATVIKTWIARDQKKAPELPKDEGGTPKVSAEEIKANNRIVCRSIDKNCRDLVNAGLICIKNDSIEINNKTIRMDDPDLRNKSINLLMELKKNPSGI